MKNKYLRNDSQNTFRASKDNIIRLVNPNKEQIFIPVPIGINPKSYCQVSFEESKGLLNLTRETDIASNQEGFSNNLRLNVKPFNLRFEHNKKTFSIGLIYSPLVLKEALDILHSEHYILGIPSGLPIVLKEDNSEEVIGILYFSRLTHGNPLGRKNFLKMEKIIGANPEDSEVREYAHMHIGFIDRIAIKKKSQDSGLGTMFLKNLDLFLKEVYPNGRLKYIEVMTSWSLEDFQSKKPFTNAKGLNEVYLEQDFLTNAGFQRISQTTAKKENRKDGGLIKQIKRKNKESKGKISSKMTKVVSYYYIKKL